MRIVHGATVTSVTATRIAAARHDDRQAANASGASRINPLARVSTANPVSRPAATASRYGCGESLSASATTSAASISTTNSCSDMIAVADEQRRDIDRRERHRDQGGAASPEAGGQEADERDTERAEDRAENPRDADPVGLGLRAEQPVRTTEQ